MIIWISGPTGAGKSTLAEITRSTGFAVVKEMLPPDLFQAFRVDPARHCASLQEAIMRSRFTQWKRLAGQARIVFDRSIDEDAEVFCRMHYEHGLLDYASYSRLRTIATELSQEMERPDLIVFLSPPQNVLMARLIDNQHPASIVDGLPRQIALYEEWASKQSSSLLRIDNSTCEPSIVARVAGIAT